MARPNEEDPHVFLLYYSRSPFSIICRHSTHYRLDAASNNTLFDSIVKTTCHFRYQLQVDKRNFNSISIYVWMAIDYSKWNACSFPITLPIHTFDLGWVEWLLLVTSYLLAVLTFSKTFFQTFENFLWMRCFLWYKLVPRCFLRLAGTWLSYSTVQKFRMYNSTEL